MIPIARVFRERQTENAHRVSSAQAMLRKRLVYLRPFLPLARSRPAAKRNRQAEQRARLETPDAKRVSLSVEFSCGIRR